MKSLYDLEFLIPLILLRGELKEIREGISRFQIAKMLAWLFVNSGIFSIEERVFVYRYGPYVLKFEDALADLLRRNILDAVKDSKGQIRFCVTDEGQRWVMSRLTEQNYRKSKSVIREIDRCLFIPISDLIIEIAEKSSLLKPIKYTIGHNELIRIFDWRNFGDGKIHGYHYTLLRSFYRLEEYFDSKRNEAQEKIEEGDGKYQVRIVDHSTILEVIRSEDLLKNTGDKHSIRYVFNKQNPRSISGNKFEGKNYIGHLWYIYSAINIIHVLAGLAPTIDEIARMCLTQYEYAIKKDISYSQIRKMREGTIRSDMQKLVSHGILNKRKIDSVHVYSIRARKITDSFASNTYSLLDASKMATLYGKEIKPSPANTSIIRQLRSSEKKS
jgi:hypothetical protein